MRERALGTLGRRQRKLAWAKRGLRETVAHAALFAMLTVAGKAAAQEPPSLAATDDPVVLEADEVDYDAAIDVATARGNVMLIQSGQELLADELEYDRRAGTVVARGDVVLRDTDGNVLLADRLDITSDFAEGSLDDLSLILADKSQIKAVKGERRNDEVTVLDKAVYSPCEICEEGGSPLWQIRADRVVHDEISKTVSYRNAKMDIFGVPVIYTPFFSHPDPTVKRRTGFLAPTFGSDSELGFTVETPYHIVLDDNADATITPLITSQEGVLVDGEYRYLSKAGPTILGGSITRTSPFQRTPDDDSDDEVRGRLRGNGRYALGNNTFGGFDLRVSSDNSFLRRYGFSNDNVLENRAFVERFDDRDLYSLEGYAFQGLRETDDQGLIPVVLPWAEFKTIRPTGILGSTLETEAGILALTRTEGLDTRRASLGSSVRLPAVGRFGELWSFDVGLRGDVYYVDGEADERAGRTGTDTTARLVPNATAEVRWPLLGTSGTWQHVVEPIVQASYTGNDVNKDNIPNEDSLVFEFDETNLFERSRFTGIDRVESGARLTYGIKTDSVGPGGLRIGAIAGQSFRSGPDQLFPDGSGLEDKYSDYVGRVDLQPGGGINLSYRFRLARESLSPRRSDLRLAFGPRRLRIALQYIRLTQDIPDLEIDEREEITAALQFRMYDNLSFGVKARRDLLADRPVSNSFGVVYTNSCLELVAGIEKNFTERGELEDETRVSIRLGFRTLGDIEAANQLF